MSYQPLGEHFCFDECDDGLGAERVTFARRPRGTRTLQSPRGTRELTAPLCESPFETQTLWQTLWQTLRHAGTLLDPQEFMPSAEVCAAERVSA